MAASAIEKGELADQPVLRGIAAHHKAKAAHIALAWVLSHPGVCAISEAGTPEHLRQNARALRVVLHEDDIMELDAAFPPPPDARPARARLTAAAPAAA